MCWFTCDTFISLLKKRITSIKRPGAHFNSELIVSLYISRSQISNFQSTKHISVSNLKSHKNLWLSDVFNGYEWEHYLKWISSGLIKFQAAFETQENFFETMFNMNFRQYYIYKKKIEDPRTCFFQVNFLSYCYKERHL